MVSFIEADGQVQTDVDVPESSIQRVYGAQSRVSQDLRKPKTPVPEQLLPAKKLYVDDF